MSTKINGIISAVWRHANLPIQFSEEWEWSNDIDDDLNAGFYGWVNLNSTADILENFVAPDNWEVLATSAASFDLDEFQPEALDMDEKSVLINPQINWNTYLDTIIVPFRFDPNLWMGLDTQGKLEAMGQVEGESSLRSDGVIFTESNSGYFDYYVSGCIEISIEVDSDDRTKAIEMASDELKTYMGGGFSQEIGRLLPRLEGNQDFDEFVELYRVPNWVLIER